MKKIIAAAFCFLGTAPLLAQSDTLVFDFGNNQKKKLIVLYDDPGRLPQWYAGAHIGFAAASYMNVSAQIEAAYRINDRAWADARYLMWVAGGDEKEGTRIGEWSGMFHYSLLSRDKTKRKKTPIDYEDGGMRHGTQSVTDVYVVMLPRQLRHELQVDAGISRLVAPGQREKLENTVAAEELSVDYYLANSRITSFNLGFSYVRYNSYSFDTDGVKRAYFGTRRLYAYIQTGIVANADYYSVDYRGDDIVTKEVSTGFTPPALSRFGWRVGYEATRGMMNTGCALSIGVEAGTPPRYSIPAQDFPAGIFNFKFGFIFGPKP